MEQHQSGDILSSSGLNEQSKSYLRQTVRWTNFLAIMGFIGTGFMILFSLLMILGGGMLMGRYNSDMPSRYGTIGYTLFGVIYLIIAALYCYPVFCLFKFGRLMKSGLATENEVQITEAFHYQRNMYRFIGIMFIVIISLYILVAISLMGTIGSRM